MRGRYTVSIQEAGQILGLKRSAAYRAAKAGDIHTIAIGSRLLVPVTWLEELLGEPIHLEHNAEVSPIRRVERREPETDLGTAAHG